jgi:multidrug resistance protein, MATE family
MNVTIGDHTEPRWAGLREVTVMAGPIILGLMSQTLMQTADGVIVAYWDPVAFAALGSSGIWVFILSTFMLGIVGCVSTFVGQSFGRGEKQHCAKYAWQGIYLSIALGALSLFLWPLAGPLFRSMPHSETVTQYEITYFQVRVFGYIFLGWAAALTAYFQAIGRPMIPMGVAFFSNLLNIALDIVFVFGIGVFPEWGIFGAGLATVISQGAMVLALHAVFINNASHRAFNTRGAYAFDGLRMRELFRIGMPAGLTFLLEATTWGVFTSWIVGYFGDVALAANNAAITVMHLSFMMAVGLNHAMAPIVGKWIGLGKPDVAVARTKTALKLAMMYMGLLGLLFALFGDKIVYFGFGRDEAVTALGHRLLILAAIFQVFDAITIVTEGSLRGAGDTRWMAVVTFLASYCVFLPLAALFAIVLEMGAYGGWVGATIYIIGLSGLFYYRFNSQKWREMSIFLDADKVVPELPGLKPAAEPVTK